MLPIITVTYKRDKWAVALQCNSIERFVTTPITHYIIIQDNSDYDEWYCLLSQIYKKHNLVLLNKQKAPELFMKPRYENDISFLNIQGYYEQQYIKLLTPCIINHSKSLSLDSKNLFIKETNLQEFLNEEGGEHLIETNNLLAIKHPCIFRYSDWFNYIDSKLGTSRPEILYFAGTPFVFLTKNIQKILSKVDINQFFLDAIDKSIMISEYHLYNYFVTQNFTSKKWSIGFNGFNPTDLNKILLDKNILFIFTLYRDSVKNKLRKIIIQNFLIKLGLDKKLVLSATNHDYNQF